MQTIVRSEDVEMRITVENDAENIQIYQEADMVMIFNERMARKFIKAIKKSAKELGWDV